MNMSMKINTGLMLILGMLLAYLAATLTVENQASSADTWGFIFGCTVSSVFFSLFLILAVRLIFRMKPMFTNGMIIIWWALFVLFNLLVFYNLNS